VRAAQPVTQAMVWNVHKESSGLFKRRRHHIYVLRFTAACDDWLQVVQAVASCCPWLPLQVVTPWQQPVQPPLQQQ
jgi:hypothetical protein